jgi:Dyp-type peroxidase family
VTLELADIQGLFARGYGDLRAAVFLLLGIEDAAAARRFVGDAAGGVTTAEARPEERALNLAFTSSGLARVGLPEGAIEQFSNEFVNGMTTPHRSRILGDLDENAPERWDWGGTAGPQVDLALLLYARDAAALQRLEAEQMSALAAGGLVLRHRLGTSDLDDFEPFGFRDGLSQPFIEGLAKVGPPERTVRAGEFVLGYPNEYGLYTDRPLLDAASDPASVLPRDPEGSGRADLGRNGSYLVFRQLQQDVPGFWRYVDSVTRRRDGSSDPQARLRLASKMVGRWPSGAPLTLAPDADDPSLAGENDFGYHELDARGARCPVASHIRRTHPRDSLDPRPGTNDSWEINRRHRILRRGREYGTSLTIDEALSGGDTTARGLNFICLNANIQRQFEFISHTWMNNPKFDRLRDDADPLAGPSAPYGGTFTIPTAGTRERVTGIPRFISVKGGAYFFLPGLAALRYLAGIPSSGIGIEPGNSSSPLGS